MNRLVNKKDFQQTKFYLNSVEEIYSILNTKEDELSKEEVRECFDTFGENKLPKAKGESALKRFLAQFNNTLIYVLLGASVFTFVMVHYVDIAVILAVVIINAVVGFVQEGKAQKALDSIKNMLSLQAAIIRAGDKY